MRETVQGVSSGQSILSVCYPIEELGFSLVHLVFSVFLVFCKRVF